MTIIMTPEEKIKYVKDEIEDKIKISPKGPVHLRLYTLTEYEEGPTLLSRGEQHSIVKKLKEDGYLKEITFDDDGSGVWVEKNQEPEKIIRVSNLFKHIKTTDELLQNRELFEKFLKIIDIKSIKAGHSYVIPTEEKNDDLIQLLIDLKLIEYDWKKLNKQKHRTVGNRIIEFKFEADKVLELYDRISGKNKRIKKQALELISKEIASRFSLNKLVEIFSDLGVPESMFVPDTKWRAVFYVLSYYASGEECLKFLKIIEELLHPLMFEGDEAKSEEARKKFKQWFKCSNFSLDDDGKVYLGPTEEEYELGIDDWMGANGEVTEPKCYSIYPDQLAELWVLVCQIAILVQAYEIDKTLAQDTLEKLYLEIIGEAEKLIKFGKVGKITETYKRPFTSLHTAQIEAKGQQANNPSDLITALLFDIAKLSPDTSEISKKLKERSELIERVTSATKANVNFASQLSALPYERAVFALKLVTGQIFEILEAVATGYLNMTSEDLNAQYVMLIDHLHDLFEIEDFEEIKKSLPQIPEHLYEGLEDVDVWWEYGLKSELMKLYGDVETLWVRAGRKQFPLPQGFVEVLNKTDEIIKQYKNRKAAEWAKMIKRVDEIRKRDEALSNQNSEKSFNKNKDENPSQQQPQKIIHEHTHRFENSIQEKGIQLHIKNEETEKDKPRFPHKLPAGTNWSEIYIKFLDDERVKIKIKQFEIETDYKKMGFIGKGGKPSEQWNFLKVLSMLNGELSIKDREAKDKYKKQKEILSKGLKDYFVIDYDPFHPYGGSTEKTEKSYKIKLNLIPPTDNKKEEEGDISEEADSLGIGEFFSEQTPSRFEAGLEE